MSDVERIEGFHAHIYFLDEAQRAHAMHLREEIGVRFERAKLGRIHEAIGPHPEPMYQVAFPSDLFAELVPWLMLNLVTNLPVV